MNWEALGASGELIGALAVVVSVLYLASTSSSGCPSTGHSRHSGTPT